MQQVPRKIEVSRNLKQFGKFDLNKALKEAEVLHHLDHKRDLVETAEKSEKDPENAPPPPFPSLDTLSFYLFENTELQYRSPTQWGEHIDRTKNPTTGDQVRIPARALYLPRKPESSDDEPDPKNLPCSYEACMVVNYDVADDHFDVLYKLTIDFPCVKNSSTFHHFC